jgi:hypothetical protein
MRRASASSSGFAGVAVDVDRRVGDEHHDVTHCADPQLADDRQRLVAGDRWRSQSPSRRAKRLVDVGGAPRRTRSRVRAQPPRRRGSEHATSRWPSASRQCHDVVVVGDDELVAIVQEVFG